MNSDYPLDQNIKVFDVIKDQMVELDPRSVNWTAVTSETFDFKLRQEPGPLNALGRVKFMFPNRFNVYIHDSPVRGLFEKTKRNFSSGCIRTEDPLNLAEYLLREEGKWDRAKILATIDSGRRRIVRLSQPIAVYILYFTAWVEHNETIHFRDDIYKRDKKLAKCLFE
jgi:murein L,D-transpeptidase YcbB/YkuD